jgi:DNA-binding transcriptional LysR family regulator
MDPALIPALYDALTVARLGSVGAAAKRLGKTPSAVSQQIRHLTDALEVPLFERRGRGLVLTQAAERVLPSATRLFDEAEAVFRLFGELGGAGATRLRIAASDYLARPLLIPVLKSLAEQGAPLAFEISTAHSEEALTRLERGDVEMAIVSVQGERAGLSARRLFEQPFAWVAPRRRGDERTALGVAERLREEPVLRLAPGSLGRRLLDRYLEEQAIRPASIIDVPSVSLVLAYAAGGIGVGLVPALALEPGQLGSLSVERAAVPRLPVALVTRAARPVVPAVERFTERLILESERRKRELERGTKHPGEASLDRSKAIGNTPGPRKPRTRP